MTQPEWLACADPFLMLEFVRDKVSDRKLRLFACACCRTIWPLLDDACQAAIETAEQYADGEVDEEELEKARVAIKTDDSLGSPSSTKHAARGAACNWNGPQLRHGGIGNGAKFASLGARLATMSQTGEADRQADASMQSVSHAALIRDVAGNLYRPVDIAAASRTRDVTGLARAIYSENSFDRMPILGDALEDSGCTNGEILSHCRSREPHIRGCWLVDRLLERK